jgi:hypothetical protein
MNPTAIYSKSGKGVQEASGKTSFLDRSDRAVLSAIDGRATLADVAKKVGKTFDSAFQTLIGKLDKDGFIREASPGAAPAAKPGAPAGKPAAKSADAGGFGDLDFSMLGTSKAASPAPSRPAAPPAKPSAPPPPPPPPPPKPKVDPAAEAAAKAQQSALQKAREEAEAKADAERQRIKLEAEAKMRAEMEAKARDEASQKIKLEAERKAKEEADAKIKAAREAAARAAAEAKAKADAEAKARVEAERKAREEAERARKAAEEEARKAREEAERIRKAAEEEARKAREEAERIRKAAEEQARKAREEAERIRKAAEEEARKAREEAERAARRKAREEEEQREEEERAAKRRQQEEEEQREAEEAASRKKKKKDEEAPAPAPAKSEAAGGLDSLMADLDSFTTREEADRKEKEEAERKAQEAAAQRAREEEERRAREEAERKQKEEARARKEEEKRRKREDEEALAKKREAEEKRLRDEEEKRKKEADERARKAKQEEVLAAQATRGPAVAVGEDTDEVRKRMLGRRGAAAPGGMLEPPSLRRRKSGWGKPVAIALVILLAAAVGAVHVMPVSTADYERAASEAFGKPVKIGEARLSLLGGGLQLKLKDIRLGDEVRIANGAASPELDALRSEKKVFSRIELDGVKLPQEAIGQALLAKVKADNFVVGRIVVRGLELTGPAVLPKPLEADLVYGEDGSLRSATVRGPDTFLARITPGTNNIEYVVTASGLPLPVLPELTLSDFGMKGTANQRGMAIAEWGGKVFGGSISGTANVRWGGGWSVDGVVTARNINAAVFAPALLSEGRGEGTGRFSMNGSEPSQLASGGRLEGTFTVNSGVLGSFDLGRVIRTSGREYAGRTQFNELSGQATYDRGAVQLRNVSIGAGALNAGASADVAQGGALTGRIVADVKSTSGGRSATATLHLGGTIKEPQVRN